MSKEEICEFGCPKKEKNRKRKEREKRNRRKERDKRKEREKSDLKLQRLASSRLISRCDLQFKTSIIINIKDFSNRLLFKSNWDKRSNILVKTPSTRMGNYLSFGRFLLRFYCPQKCFSTITFNVAIKIPLQVFLIFHEAFFKVKVINSLNCFRIGYSII